jgi:flagellar protein FlgJ
LVDVKKFLRRVGLTLLFGIPLLWLIVPPYRMPVQGPFTSTFFTRLAPDKVIFDGLEMHSGLDIAAPRGTPARSSKSGRVVAAGNVPGYGNRVIVRHWLGFSSAYAHLDRITVREGDWVVRGARVGLVGATGRATGPHLHFEIRWRDAALPPGFFLIPARLRGWLVGLIT